jgi:hypothetical protein
MSRTLNYCNRSIPNHESNVCNLSSGTVDGIGVGGSAENPGNSQAELRMVIATPFLSDLDTS